MKPFRLSTKLLFITSITLLLFSIASLWVLYRAQSKLAVSEMDQVLTTEAASLSSLVSAFPGGKLEFDFSSYFVRQYQKAKSTSFFRFFEAGNSQPVRASLHSPMIGCSTSVADRFINWKHDGITYRILSHLFQPEPDEDARRAARFLRPTLCLVVGVDQAPYRKPVLRTIYSTIPILAIVLGLSFMFLIAFIRTLTRELSQLSLALTRSDFSATHSFPALPPAKTPEVKAVVEKLEALHHEAAQVYQGMWLFLGRASHQLKTPVTALRSTLDVLLRKDRDKEELVSGLTDIRGAVEQIGSLTQKLITSSRVAYSPSLQASEMERINLEEFFREHLRIFAAQAEQKGTSIRLHPGCGAQVFASNSLLAELFGSLIENAIIYTRPGSTVTIRWRLEREVIVASIEDEGHGVPASVREHLFEPFIRGDERMAPGSGLGLSIANKAAQILGAKIELAETSAEGSRFDVVLRNAKS